MLSTIVPRMGRPLLYPDQTIARLPPGTLQRIHASLRPGEAPADFIRFAVAVELARRQLEQEEEARRSKTRQASP